jgi:hypothetical protein
MATSNGPKSIAATGTLQVAVGASPDTGSLRNMENNWWS